MNETKKVNVRYPAKFAKELVTFAKCLDHVDDEGGIDVSWFITASNNPIDFAKNQKVIKKLITMYPNKPLWKAFKKLEGKYFWIGAMASAVVCGATYFVTKKRRKKKFAERMLKVQEAYSEDPIAKNLEMVGVMEHELKDLGYFEESHDLFEEDV